jgi:hypothetical protein
MNILPGPLQITAIALSFFLPVLLFCYARIPELRNAGHRFRVVGGTVLALYAAACLILPGARDYGDALGGFLLLATAILLCHVFWSLLAWGFTLTLLTALARAEQPLTLEQWVSSYMHGGNLSGFARNRLRLLIGAGMIVPTGDQIAVTPIGFATVRVVRVIRFVTGIG